MVMAPGLKNCFRVHLNLAATENDVWKLPVLLLAFFKRTMKISLLTKLKDGELILEELLSACQRYSFH